MNKVLSGMGSIATTVVASVILVLLGIIYFMLTIWTIKIGAGWAGYGALDGNMIVLAASIVTAASLIGSSLKR